MQRYFKNRDGIDDLSSAFRGGLLEQLTGQEILASDCQKRATPLFWVRDKTQSQAEVDFLLTHGAVALPIEVKAGAAGKLRSLHRFVDMCPIAQTGMRLYRGTYSVHEAKSCCQQYQLANIPHYHASKLRAYANALGI